MLKTILTSATGQPFSVQDIRKLQRRLKEIEPSLRTEFMREVKKVGKEPEKAIIKSIPTTSPLSGFTKQGATLKWGQVTKGAKKGGARSTTIRFRTAAGGRSLTATLLSIRINSATSSVADMAGRSGRYIGAGYKNSGFSKPIRRTYSDGSQSVQFRRRATQKAGVAFLRVLNRELGSGPSRMGYRAVEQSLPALSKDVQAVVNKWMREYSGGF